MVAKKPIPSLAFKLKFQTATSLQAILTAQYAHALEEQKLGHPALMNAFETVGPFYKAITEYVEEHSK